MLHKVRHGLPILLQAMVVTKHRFVRVISWRLASGQEGPGLCIEIQSRIAGVSHGHAMEPGRVSAVLIVAITILVIAAKLLRIATVAAEQASEPVRPRQAGAEVGAAQQVGRRAAGGLDPALDIRRVIKLGRKRPGSKRPCVADPSARA